MFPHSSHHQGVRVWLLWDTLELRKQPSRAAPPLKVDESGWSMSTRADQPLWTALAAESQLELQSSVRATVQQ